MSSQPAALWAGQQGLARAAGTSQARPSKAAGAKPASCSAASQPGVCCLQWQAAAVRAAASNQEPLFGAAAGCEGRGS